MVTSNLLVSFAGGGALLQVHSLQDGVFAQFSAYVKNGPLRPLLLVQCSVLGRFLALKGLIVDKQLKLHRFAVVFDLAFGDDVVGGDAKSPYGE